MKINDLRAAIVAKFPDFATDPDRLCMWTEKGGIRSPATGNRHFEWEYVANITLEEFAGHPSVLFLAINDWLAINQLDLLQPSVKEAYQFETVVLDSGAVDCHVQIRLTERVTVIRNSDGTDTLQHQDDSVFLLSDDEPMGTLTTVFTGGEQTIPGPPLPLS